MQTIWAVWELLPLLVRPSEANWKGAAGLGGEEPA
jgi:hypothetical protein